VVEEDVYLMEYESAYICKEDQENIKTLEKQNIA
jgi:hypothetical protein